jgi:hypothetical protein
METTIISEFEVLDFVKKELSIISNSNQVLAFYSINAKDIIKYIEHPEKCGNWPFDFVCSVIEAIKKIKAKYIVPDPKIENQTEEDRVLSKLLAKNKYYCFGTNTFFKDRVSIEHVIHYMERSAEIKNWNAYFLQCVQLETVRIKEFLL